jgi:hypothetical protein
MPFVQTIKYFLREIIIYRRKCIRFTAFEIFINKNFNVSSIQIFGKEDKIPVYDIYIFGSDQIWNPKLTMGFDDIFFGFFKTNNLAKKISVAASTEIKELTKKEEEYLKGALENFDCISVRENNLQNLLQPLTNKKISTILDPTLIANKSVFEKITIQPKINKKYILLYMVRVDKNVIKIAHHLAEQLDADVIQLTIGINKGYVKNRYQCESPGEFLGWLKNASCIVSTSFHGTAFSIIFNKPFYAISLKDNSESRIENLLRKLNLENRFIDKSTKPIYSEIDYTAINAKLEELKKESILFLQTSLTNPK